MNNNELVQNVEESVKNSNISDIDEFRSRICESDSYEGVSVTILGNHVPIDPIFDTIRDMEEWRIQNMGMHGDIRSDRDQSDGENNNYEKGVVIFFAYIGDVIDDDLFV